MEKKKEQRKNKGGTADNGKGLGHYEVVLG